MGKQSIEEAWAHFEDAMFETVASEKAAVRALLMAVLEEADMGFDEKVVDSPKCNKCSWNSGPYSMPCEEHSQSNALRARIEALGR